MTTLLKVLIVARPGDKHADLVEEVLLQRGLPIFRISLDTLHSTPWVWSPAGRLSFSRCGSLFGVEKETVVWWRRLGQAKTDDLASAEADFVLAEFRQFMRGILVGSGARFVDEPGQVELAENKLYQLRVASELGLDVPETVVTNCLDEAQDFIRRGPVVAKAVSVGPGLAPYVQEVPQELLSLLCRAPALLQRAVYAEADMRLVTVGEQVFAWKRSRIPGEPLDWRLSDPLGKGFCWCEADSMLRELAIRLVNALGLSTSVQDWLLAEGRYVFLEANPQGQWVFLQESQDIVLPVFVRHLVQPYVY